MNPPIGGQVRRLRNGRIQLVVRLLGNLVIRTQTNVRGALGELRFGRMNKSAGFIGTGLHLAGGVQFLL